MNGEVEKTRKENDLDSIAVGSASEGGPVKIYFDRKTDNLASVEADLMGMVEIAKKAKARMKM